MKDYGHFELYLLDETRTTMKHLANASLIDVSDKYSDVITNRDIDTKETIGCGFIEIFGMDQTTQADLEKLEDELINWDQVIDENPENDSDDESDVVSSEDDDCSDSEDAEDEPAFQVSTKFLLSWEEPDFSIVKEITHATRPKQTGRAYVLQKTGLADIILPFKHAEERLLANKIIDDNPGLNPRQVANVFNEHVNTYGKLLKSNLKSENMIASHMEEREEKAQVARAEESRVVRVSPYQPQADCDRFIPNVFARIQVRNYFLDNG